MRDTARIERILPLLKEVWSMVPDWRLGQLMVNIAAESGWGDRTYYVEDQEVEETLRAWKEQWKEEKSQ